MSAISKENEHQKVMQLAIKKARETMNQDLGGPFGAAIIDANGSIISVASNGVLGDKDPTAHAEMKAIRIAAAKKDTYDLSGCILYTTAHPCPMCLGAIIWANIKEVYYGCRKKDADKIGFRDDFIYKFIVGGMKDEKVLKIEETQREACLEIFKEYQDKGKKLY